MDRPVRKRLRLPAHDYRAPGSYFITLCTKDRRHTLSEVVGQGLCPCRLLPLGRIAEEELRALPARFPSVQIDYYTIMPNHIHLLVTLSGMRQGQSPCPTEGGPDLGAVMGAFKSITTKRANQADAVRGRKVWHTRYYEHAVRNEQDYREIWRYIAENPAKWAEDQYHTL